jgi:hypothetical protein
LVVDEGHFAEELVGPQYGHDLIALSRVAFADDFDFTAAVTNTRWAITAPLSISSIGSFRRALVWSHQLP